MKKLNKKGFTLIELLAVIIILGVLMIIAIPSVTEYISSSRKSAFVDTAAGYIDSVRTKVNQSTTLQFYDVNTLYLVPVGNQNSGVCVSVEKGGTSPFSDKWEYAYVGVTYNGKNYNYYFMAKDGSNQGINFVSDGDLAKKGGDLVVSGTLELIDYANLKTHYGSYATDGKFTGGNGKRYQAINFTNEVTEGDPATALTGWPAATNKGKFTTAETGIYTDMDLDAVVKADEPGKNIDVVHVVTAAEC